MTDFRLDLDARPGIADLRRLGGVADEEMPALARLVEAEVALLERGPRVTPAAAFEGRPGYDEEFLGFKVPLPRLLGRRARDVLPVPSRADGRLDYQHFSIVMSRARRIAALVACNVDGSRSRKIDREDDKWAYDGRIPIEAQLGEELYVGNELDRGHLVRREDPNWGDEDMASTANEDTFHFTNCSPQMAGFNQKIWLGLENYLLENTRRWKERVTVFTGPLFGPTDLAYRDALIPLAYWKVIAFVDDAGRPSATAYTISQERELGGLEAAFGRYKTYQRGVRRIEELTSLDFGPLRGFDGLSNEEERTGIVVEVPLRTLGDIRI